MKRMKGGSAIIKVVKVAGNVNFPILQNKKKLVFAYFTSQFLIKNCCKGNNFRSVIECMWFFYGISDDNI